MDRTFYEVLDVPEDAPQEAIEEAYREKVKEYHPDVSDREDAAERFKRVVRAEEVLGDPEERTAYDRMGHEQYVRRVEGQNVGEGEHSPWTTRSRGDRRAGGGFDPAEAAGNATGGGGGATTAGGGRSRRRSRREPEGTADPSQGFGTAADRQHGSATEGTAGSRRSRAAYGAAGGGGASANSTYSVHDWEDKAEGPETVTLAFTQELMIVAVAMFFLYPVLVYGTLNTSFPMAANATLGICTLLAVGFLLTIPKVAITVFGAWSVVAPIGLLTMVDWSLSVSLLAIGVCWIPFAYAVTVAYVVKPD